MQPRKKGIDVVWLPLDALIVDERVQRQVIKARTKYLTETFDPEKVGIVTVSQRDDGRYYVIDGQHRVLAARGSGHASMRVKCYVKHGLTLAEEAEHFLSANDARAVSPVDKYRVGLVAGDPATLAVEGTITKHGFRVSSGSSDGVIRCVEVLYQLDRQGLLDETLSVATEAWGTRSEAVEQLILRGLGQVLGRFNGELDRGSLVKKLAKRTGGASGLIADARALAGIRGVSKTRALAEIVVDTYNQRRQSGALPPL